MVRLLSHAAGRVRLPRCVFLRRVWSMIPRKEVRRGMKKILTRVLIVLLVLYVALVAGLAYAMRQPPETFGRVMKHAPMAAFLVLPFETLWTHARAGSLDVGESAPDFSLNMLDHARQVKLSDFRGRKPVVLIFGSYT